MEVSDVKHKNADENSNDHYDYIIYVLKRLSMKRKQNINITKKLIKGLTKTIIKTNIKICCHFVLAKAFNLKKHNEIVVDLKVQRDALIHEREQKEAILMSYIKGRGK